MLGHKLISHPSHVKCLQFELHSFGKKIKLLINWTDIAVVIWFMILERVISFISLLSFSLKSICSTKQRCFLKSVENDVGKSNYAAPHFWIKSYFDTHISLKVIVHCKILFSISVTLLWMSWNEYSFSFRCSSTVMRFFPKMWSTHLS